MKDQTIQAKTDRKSDTGSRQQAAAGPNGASSAPPGYGIDFLDKQLEAANRAGLPGPLKAGIENLSGLSMNDVRVHYNSPKPMQLQAFAYTQGTDIHVGPGHEQHLPHEAWHVVQQAQGRVQPTMQIKGEVPVNHDKGLEREADEMGAKAAQMDGVMDNAKPGHVTARPARGECVQLWSWAETKEKAYDSMIAGIHKGRDGMLNGLSRLASEHLPAYLMPVANGIIEGAVTVVNLLVAIIMAVLGIVVGFGEGIIGMIEGLFKLAFGVITILYDLIAGIFTNFDAAKQDLKAVWEALKGLPSAFKKLVTDWLDKFGKASSERQSLMIGELTGQVLALIATYALAAGRSGSGVKVAATGGDAAAASGETAIVAGTAGDAAATAARARPVLTVIEGGGGRGGIAAVRAAAGPGAGDMAGTSALKVAPAVDPIAPPAYLVPPLPVKAVPIVAPAAPAALTPSAAKTVVAGIGVATTTVAKVAPKPAPKKPSCGSPTGLTRADPIPMVWYKVREDDYYPQRLSIHGKAYERDDPENPLKLPHGEPLGVPNRYWPRLGKPMQLLPSTRGPKARDFRAALTGYGFDWSGLQADHVQDLDWGGPDAFENLWPLSDSANLSAGSRQNNHQRITYCETRDGPHVVNQPLSDFKLGPGHYGRYFIIAKVER